MRPKQTDNKLAVSISELDKKVDQKVKEVGLVEVEQVQENLPIKDLSNQLDRVGALNTDDETRSNITIELVSLFKTCTILVTVALCLVFVWVGIRPVHEGVGGINDLAKLVPYFDRVFTTMEPIILVAIGYFFGRNRSA